MEQSLPQHFVDVCNQLWATISNVEPFPTARANRMSTTCKLLKLFAIEVKK